jgi:hypothetical protein
MSGLNLDLKSMRLEVFLEAWGLRVWRQHRVANAVVGLRAVRLCCSEIEAVPSAFPAPCCGIRAYLGLTPITGDR